MHNVCNAIMNEDSQDSSLEHVYSGNVAKMGFFSKGGYSFLVQL